MNATRKTAIGVAVSTTVLTAGLALGSFGAASGAPAQDSVVPASAASRAPVVTATMTHSSIHLSPAGSLHAGLTIFKVVTRARHGDHTLQLLRLHHGYSMQQASSDINKAFQGNLPAIHRVDKRITWLGGAEATKGHPGRYAISLKAGKYLALDQSGNGLARIRVKGKLVRHSGVHPAGPITTKHNQFHSNSSLPRSGWVRFHNNAEEPHFMVFQHVKASTTKAQVRRYQRSGSNARPPWALFPSVSSGVVSPGHRIDYRYSLPAGKYLLACFWPSKDSGMPHFYMGMWKLIHLR